MNIWHDMSADRIHKDRFWALIEISKGCKNKYELDKETGILRLDRVLYTSTHYPANYGFIPRTLAQDHDPLDVLVLCQENIAPMTIVECKPIGVLKMIDNDEVDEKIIALPISDPTYSSYQDITDLPDHVFEEIQHFFRVYKSLENRVTAVQEVCDRAEAERIIEECMLQYKIHYCGQLN